MITSDAKMKPIDFEASTYIDFVITILMIKITNLKFVTMLKCQNIKAFFANVYTPNWLEEAFVIQKVKNTVPWAHVTEDINGEETVGTFTKNSCKNKSNRN